MKRFERRRAMTSYLLFAGIGLLIYGSVALGETAVAGLSDARISVESCAGQCREGRQTNRAPSAGVRGESKVVAAGKRLFQQRGCVDCHLTGVGPSLDGVFGRPVQDPTCGVAIVDDAYLREAILDPSATVAAGYPPVMPAFQGLLTEEELQSLIEYLKSLSDRP